MLLIVVIAMIVMFVAIFGKTLLTIKSSWKHFYDGIQFSPSEFYNNIKVGLNERKVDVNVHQESFIESHFFSAKRVYLRLIKGEYVFYICAAPFGTGMFVSWWLCIKDEKIINKIPILNKLVGRDRKNKTFYQMDTEAMYQLAIHSTVISVADEFTSAKGLRLTELDRQLHITK
jgi:hypothetical protein